MRRTTSRPGTCSAFFLEVNAVNGISATSAREIQRLGLFVEDGVGVLDRGPGVLADGRRSRP